MALKKKKKFDTGASGEYWRIMEVLFAQDRPSGMLVGIYLNQKARTAGCKPLGTAQVTIEQGKLLYVEDKNFLAKAYTLLKNEPDLVGAKDV